MKKFSKKGIKRIAALCGAMVISAASLLPNTMAAGNISNHDWSFEFASSSTSGFATSARDKQDSTSVYFRCDNATLTQGSGSTSGVYFKATAYGAKTKSGTYTNMAYNGKSSATYSMQAGKTQYMINYIYESGGRFAKVRYQTVNGGYIKFSGVWSPDSI